MRKLWDRWGFVLFLILMGALIMYEAVETNTVSEVVKIAETDQDRYLRLIDEAGVTLDWIENARNDPTTGDYFIGESYHGNEVLCVNMGGANGYACQ